MRRLAFFTGILAVCAANGMEHVSGEESLVVARVSGSSVPTTRAFDAKAFGAEQARLQTRLRAALQGFDASVKADPTARDEWRAYLKWNDWAEPFVVVGAPNASKSSRIPIAEMKRMAWRLYAAKQGFENAQIVELRSALTDYITFNEAIEEAHGDLAAETHRRSERLSRAMQAKTPDFEELEAAAWWLAVTRQSPESVAQVRASFDSPVIVLQAHRELVEAKLDSFQKSSHEVRPTRNRIQGSTVVGTANVSSHTTAELIDAPQELRLRITSKGTVQSPHNVANSGRVRVTSSANSQFTATADIYWDGGRFIATTPQATADTRSTIKSIDAPLLIRRAANRRVQGSRSSAEAQGESVIEREAVESMSSQLAVVVEKLEKKSAGFLAFMARTGNAAQKWKTGVSPTAIEIGYTPLTASGIGAAPREMPPLPDNATLGLSFHDAGLESIFRSQLAGKVWTDANFTMLQRELTGGNTPELMIGLEPERWSAQWSWRHPVRIHFTPERTTVRYRFSHVEIDGSAYEVPFEVRAELTVSAPPLGLEMKMLSPATVVSVDPQNPLPPHFQAFLERKFRGLFEDTFHLDGLHFPPGGALDGMSAFRVAGVSVEPNWVHLRYTNRKPAASPVALDAAANLAP